MPSILAIDDNARDRERFVSLLADTGANVIACSNAEEALARIEVACEEVVAALVLWELSGGVSGPELISKLRDRRPALAIIAVSATLNVRQAVRARALGAVDLLLKPLDGATVRAAVARAVGPPPPPNPILTRLREMMVGTSTAFVSSLTDLARAIPRPDQNLLLIGESGTGKELLAQAVHALGPRAHDQWTAVNVASVPTGVLESELFGHEQGAFTDAKRRRVGYFEECGAGTLFLDEIGELNLDLQAKILRIMQERSFRRVGGEREIAFRARLVCATNVDLPQAVAAGRFRRDLYFRLNEFEIRVPPLRDRGDDLSLLVYHFLKNRRNPNATELADSSNTGHGAEVIIDREALALLRTHSFPGNVRELNTILNRAVAQCRGNRIRPMDLPVEMMMNAGEPTGQSVGGNGSPPPRGATPQTWPEDLLGRPYAAAIEQVEREFNRQYLPKRFEEAGGKVLPAARRAGLDPKTFRRKWEECGLGRLSSRLD